MLFPPAEEYLDIPPEFVGRGDLLGTEVMAVRGNPVIGVFHPVSDQADRPLRLIDTWGSQKDHSVVEDNAIGFDVVLPDLLPFCGSLNPADKMLALSKPFVETLVTLIVAIHDGCFSRGEDLADERSFIPFAVRKEKLLGNTVIQVETDMDLGLLGAVPIIGPVHGQNSIDERAVDKGQVAQLSMSSGQLLGRFCVEFLEELYHLLQSPGTDVLKKAALPDALLRGDVSLGKIALPQSLQKVTPRMMLFEMEVHQDVDLIRESHLQGPVASRCQGG